MVNWSILVSWHSNNLTHQLINRYEIGKTGIKCEEKRQKRNPTFDAKESPSNVRQPASHKRRKTHKTPFPIQTHPHTHNQKKKEKTGPGYRELGQRGASERQTKQRSYKQDHNRQ
jgi:hypothetical protein